MAVAYDFLKKIGETGRVKALGWDPCSWKGKLERKKLENLKLQSSK